jgi:hypothetical protein
MLVVCVYLSLFQLLAKAHTDQRRRESDSRDFGQIIVRLVKCKVLMAISTGIIRLYSVNAVLFR